MARQSLRPHLNQIRTWARQGRTDAWIAHQLDVSVQQIAAFKRDNELIDDNQASDFDDDIDLRAEDDALVAAELGAVEEAETSDGEADEGADDEDGPAKSQRRRPRRRGRGPRRGGGGVLEGAFDHGEEGYGLWLDPAVQDDPVYAEHWAGHRPITVTIEENQIVIRRAGEDEAGEDDS
jgi:hypothetical protein